MDTRSSRQEPRELEVERARIREKSKNGTALKEREPQAVPSAFTARAGIPLPAAAKQAY